MQKQAGYIQLLSALIKRLLLKRNYWLIPGSHLHEGLRRSLQYGRLQLGHSSARRASASRSGGAVRLLNVFRQRGLRQEPHGALVAEEGVVPLWDGGIKLHC